MEKEKLELTIDELIKYNQLKWESKINQEDYMLVPKILLGGLAFFFFLKYLIGLNPSSEGIMNLVFNCVGLWIFSLVILLIIDIIAFISRRRYNKKLFEKIISERSLK